MLYGYMGKLLFVDLSNGTFEIRELTEELARNFIGGYGLGAKILYDEMPAHTDVFAPESMVGFLAGPMSASRAFFGGRYMVVSKSPVTGMWNDANSGGYFGAKLRHSGFDGIFVKGISEKPVYLYLNDGNVEIRDASHLWGKRTIETEEILRAEVGEDMNAAIIGAAGERLSHMACVMNDEHRAAGRGGTGAVMGSKKLKAVVVRGDREVPVFDKERLVALNRQVAEDMLHGANKDIREWGNYGTAGQMRAMLLIDDAGVKNWSSTYEADYPLDKGNAIYEPAYEAGYKVARYVCHCCPLGCGAKYEIDDPKGKLPKHGASRPEYESQAGLSSNMLNSDRDAVVYVNYLTNEYGFDSIAFINTLSWACECYEKGVLTKEQLNGIDFKWGDPEAMEAVAEAVCQDVGEAARILRNGTQFAADLIGAGHEYLFTIGGIESALHDPRNSPWYLAEGAVEPTPGRHMKSPLGGSLRGQAREIRYNQRGLGFTDAKLKSENMFSECCGYCHMYDTAIANLKWDYLQAITGFTYTPIEKHLVGMRIFHMRNAFNVREGWKRGDFAWSDRIIGKPPLESGANAGVTHDVNQAIDSFYEAMWMDMDGKPYKETLEWLGHMEEVIEDLYGEDGKV